MHVYDNSVIRLIVAFWMQIWSTAIRRIK